MSEVLESNLIEPVHYNPNRYVDLVYGYIYGPDDLPTEETDRLFDELSLQLQSDVAALREQLPTTFEGLLAADQVNAAWHMAHWEQYGYAEGGFIGPLPGDDSRKVGREACDYLRKKITETAEGNGWKAYFDKPHPGIDRFPGGLTWRMEQATWIFDGQHLAQIGPTLFQIPDRSPLGDRAPLVRGLGPSHLRKHALVRTVLPVMGNELDSTRFIWGKFTLEDGKPQDYPNIESIEFLEKVLAAYY